MNFKDENELLAALKTGSRTAFERVYKDNLQLLWGEAFKILEENHAANDAVQELFIEFWEKKLYEKIESNIRAYLFTCIRHKCYKISANKKHTGTFSLSESANHYEDKSYENKELHQHVAATMTNMSPQSSKVFELYILEGKKRKDVAQELGISDNTAKSYLATALKIARKKLLKFKNDTPL